MMPIRSSRWKNELEVIIIAFRIPQKEVFGGCKII